MVLLDMLLPFLARLSVFLVENVLAHPAVAAMAMGCFSMVGVSVLGFVVLVVALWALLAPSR